MSAPSGSPGRNTRAARPGSCAARPPTPRPPRPKTRPSSCRAGQALVVIAPVRDLALLLRDVVASVLVQLEGQGGHPGSDGGPPCYLDRAPGATRGIPATTWRRCERCLRCPFSWIPFCLH